MRRAGRYTASGDQLTAEQPASRPDEISLSEEMLLQSSCQLGYAE